jgi:hypothetical protein
MANNFTTALPTVDERRRMSAYAASKAVVTAYDAAFEELRRRNLRVDILSANKLLGYVTRGDIYQVSRTHVEAVEIWGISPALSRADAIKRMRQLDPAIQTLARKAREASIVLDDAELMADAIGALIRALDDILTRYDVSMIAGYLTRYPEMRGGTKSALLDLNRWLSTLERAL